MSEVRILVDECVIWPIIRELRKRLPDFDILVVGDTNAPRESTPDTEILAYRELEHRLFLSSDRRTMPGHVGEYHRRGGHTYGVLMVGGGLTVSEVVDEVEAICRACLIWRNGSTACCGCLLVKPRRVASNRPSTSSR